MDWGRKENFQSELHFWGKNGEPRGPIMLVWHLTWLIVHPALGYKIGPFYPVCPLVSVSCGWNMIPINIGRYTPNSWTFCPPCFGSGFCYLSSGRLLFIKGQMSRNFYYRKSIVNVAKLLDQNKPDKRFRDSVYLPVLSQTAVKEDAGSTPILGCFWLDWLKNLWLLY